MGFLIHQDGSFDLSAGPVTLRGAYPAADGTPLRPVRVETAEDRAVYFLPEGRRMELRFAPFGKGASVTARLTGFSAAHDVSVFAAAAAEGGGLAFRQGKGMAGPSGFVRSEEDDFESDGILALGGDRGVCTLCVPDQTRFRSRFVRKDGAYSALFDGEGCFGEEETLPALCLDAAGSFDEGLRACAGRIAGAMGARPVTIPAFHWCSWYYLYHNLDETILEEYLRGFSALKADAPFSHIQIDAGYFPACGDWLLPSPRFPEGLKKAADAIRAAGYEPGIWIGPFMVGDASQLYRDHPDWMLRGADGTLVRCWTWYNEPKVWGYRDCDYYVLDTSHPDAMAYLRGVFRTLRSWGFTLFKTDFLFWGLQDSSGVLRHAPGKTSVEYFRDVLAMIREEIGEDARWLGCISPFLPAVGYVDMMRVAGDVGAQWERTGFGPENMIRELTADQYFNGVYWQNDPDAVMLRDFHIHLRQEQIEALALLAAVSGGTVYTSDPVHEIAPDRLALLRLIRPRHVLRPEYPLWEKDRPTTLIVNRLPRGTVLYWFNPTDDEVTETPDWDALLPAEQAHFRFLHGEEQKREDVVYFRVPPRSGRLLFASEDPIPREPENLWEF